MFIVQYLDGGLVSSPTQFSPAEAFNDYCTMVSVAHKRKFNETDRDAAFSVWFEEMVKNHEFHISYVIDKRVKSLDQYLVTADGRS